MERLSCCTSIARTRKAAPRRCWARPSTRCAARAISFPRSQTCCPDDRSVLLDQVLAPDAEPNAVVGDVSHVLGGHVAIRVEQVFAVDFEIAAANQTTA